MYEALLHRFPKVVVFSYECLSMVASWRASIGLVVSCQFLGIYVSLTVTLRREPCLIDLCLIA